MTTGTLIAALYSAGAILSLACITWLEGTKETGFWSYVTGALGKHQKSWGFSRYAEEFWVQAVVFSLLWLFMLLPLLVMLCASKARRKQERKKKAKEAEAKREAEVDKELGL